MSDSLDPEAPEKPKRDPELSERRKEFTRRALIRAGWVVPLVTTVNIPSASAQSPAPHNDVHGDVPHQDDIVIHADVHLDDPQPPHDDHADHTDHSDTPTHSDLPPHDDHTDGATHADSHGDAHQDHDDHDDGHADHTFRDHTDAGHTDHLDFT